MEEVVNKLIRFPKELVDEISKYQKENYLPSFTAAVIQLIAKGLKK